MNTAERMALAILNGDDSPEVRETLRQANRENEITRQAESVRAYRAGEPVWTWPATTPWEGF